MELSVIGLGYVGLVAAACFAKKGHSVTCVDKDMAKLTALREGRSPFYEPNLEILLNECRSRMSFVDQVTEAIEASDIIFVAVGTPQAEQGEVDLGALNSVCDQVFASTQSAKTLVIKSTLPLGTIDVLESHRAQDYPDSLVEIVYNPEFLREGQAVHDFLNPDRVVLGGHSSKAIEQVLNLYRPFLKDPAHFHKMEPKAAEMTKYVANTFLALKVSFINEVARVCDEVGVDVGPVRDAFSDDHRISRHFFEPGVGFGGSCFPKDVAQWTQMGQGRGVSMAVAQAVLSVNEEQKNWPVQELLRRFEGQVRGLRVALWGLSFKAQTDDVRESAALHVVEALDELGARVKAYDPVAKESFRRSVKANIEYGRDPLEVTKDADVLLILTDWPEFSEVDLKQVQILMNGSLVIDGRNMIDSQKAHESGFELVKVGRPVGRRSLK